MDSFIDLCNLEVRDFQLFSSLLFKAVGSLLHQRYNPVRQTIVQNICTFYSPHKLFTYKLIRGMLITQLQLSVTEGLASRHI